MYEYLIKRLRNCISDTVEDCAGCPYIGGYNGTYCMNGLITEAADAIEVLSKMEKTTRWIPVTEKLPKLFETVYEGEPCVDGELVLVFAPKAEADVAWNDRAVGKWLGDRWEVSDEAFTLNAITHWMPLPEPPKEET